MAEGLDWATMLTMGMTTAGVVAVGMGLGWAVDTAAGTFPTFLLVGVVVGILGAATYMITKFRTYLKNSQSR